MFCNLFYAFVSIVILSSSKKEKFSFLKFDTYKNKAFSFLASGELL